MGTVKKINTHWIRSTYSFPVTPNKAFKVETETSGEFCRYPPKYQKRLNFVTLEDILPGQIEYNYVIYNPMLSKEQNMKILKNAHDETFKHHPITDDDLDELTIFDKNHLEDFITEYKKFLNII